VDRGHRTGSSPSYTWTSAYPGSQFAGTCKVTIFDVEITTPSSFPAFVGLNEDLVLGCTVYPTDTNSAGTFSWTKVTGPGTVTFSNDSSSSEDPNFSANQAGTYTAKVEFTIDNSPGGCTESPITVSDTSGDIVVVEVDVLEVPDFLFASVEYATPIRFKVKGLGSQVEIDDITADLYLDGACAKANIPIGDRFVNGTGTIQNNGATDTYTGYVNSVEYLGISLGTSHRTNNAKFIISVKCRETGSGEAYVTYDSKLSDNEAKMKIFCDDVIFAVEPGLGLGVSKEYTESLSLSPVYLLGKKKWEHWQAGVNNPFCCQATGPDAVPYPHEEPETYEGAGEKCGMEKLWPADFGDYHELSIADHTSSAEQYVRLFDDADIPTECPYSNGVKGMIYGRRLGATFAASYGPKALASGILGIVEYAMDLSKNSGKYSWKIFETGQVKRNLKCEQSTGIDTASLLADLCGGVTVWSVLFPHSTALTITFGTAAVVFDLISNLDMDSGIEKNAEAALRLRFVTDRWPYDYSSAAHDDVAVLGDPYVWKTDTGGSWDTMAKDVEFSNEPWTAGEVYTMFIELECAASAESREIPAVDVWSWLVYECTGDASISAQSDFQNMYLSVRSP